MHTTGVRDNGPLNFTASCSCGWSSQHTTSSEAAHAARAHKMSCDGDPKKGYDQTPPAGF